MNINSQNNSDFIRGYVLLDETLVTKNYELWAKKRKILNFKNALIFMSSL